MGVCADLRMDLEPQQALSFPSVLRVNSLHLEHKARGRSSAPAVLAGTSGRAPTLGTDTPVV